MAQSFAALSLSGVAATPGAAELQLAPYSPGATVVPGETFKTHNAAGWIRKLGTPTIAENPFDENMWDKIGQDVRANVTHSGPTITGLAALNAIPAGQAANEAMEGDRGQTTLEGTFLYLNGAWTQIEKPNAVDQTVIDAAVAAEQTRATGVETDHETRITAVEGAVPDPQTAMNTAERHPGLSLTTDPGPAPTLDGPTQALNIPPAAPPETKDTTPTAASTVAVESQGIKTYVDAETSRAVAAEIANAVAVGAETTRATAAEGVNAGAIAAETTRATAEEVRVQAELDAEEATTAAHRADTELHLPAATASASQYLRRNVTNDGWETVDLPVSPQNFVAGVGAPDAADGADGFFYQEVDAALGTNDIWGPKVAGAWPAQADHRTADPTVGALTDVDNAVEGVIPKSWAADVIVAMARGQALHFDSYTDAQAATIQPGQFVIVGKGSNYAGTWRHHGTTASLFESAGADYTKVSAQTLVRTAVDVADAPAWGTLLPVGGLLAIGDGGGVWRALTGGTPWADDANWARVDRAAQLPVVWPGDGAFAIGKAQSNFYEDDTIGGFPTPGPTVTEYAIGISPANRTDSKAIRDAAKPKISHFSINEEGDGWLQTDAVQGGAGLRGEPVADQSALVALVPSDYERRKRLDDDSEWVFELGKTPGAGDIADAAATGAWVLQTPQLIGPAVERAVFTRNRDQTIVFGDLNFMCPTSGGSSLNMRRGSSPSMTVTHFSTFWSNQQGGASEQTPTFTVSTSWRPFRQAGLNLTQHNNYQEGSFVCNGWMYNIQVIVGSGWTGNRFTCTRWRLDAVKGEPGTDGVDGTDAASIDHVSLTAGDSSPGTTDTYTLWADAGETVSLGTYDVPIPSATGIQTVELASYAGSHTTGQTLTLAGGRTWQNVLDEFQFVYVNVGANNLFSHDQSRQWHVSDLGVQNIDMAITDYQTHGSNSYHYKLRCPAGNSTTVRIDNDGSSMSAQRIKVIGVK